MRPDCGAELGPSSEAELEIRSEVAVRPECGAELGPSSEAELEPYTEV